MSPAFYSDNTSGSAWLGTQRYRSAARRTEDLSSPFLAGELNKQKNKYARKSAKSNPRSHGQSSHAQDSRFAQQESHTTQSESQKVSVADIRAQLSKGSYFSGGLIGAIQDADEKRQQNAGKNPKKKPGQNSKKGKKEEGGGGFSVFFWIIVCIVFAYYKFL
ncbi:anti-sigma28 factor (negative regulator of flagellin synthesis) [Arcanobacterium pluranimalium]|uniref:hypothetical protein n=1 Tax=Arcanobacterium pluranimalium TaxID=108028 RepID=UPI0019576A1C|nr:hypothetical protein [Arcanobacterium pluranimalium]MBM7824472.1 anti-sigma28 factor (negative regulator of flagellin synthesis) [Arcanobacterium pluranimalium]